jgi:hypothetical protein
VSPDYIPEAKAKHIFVAVVCKYSNPNACQSLNFAETLEILPTFVPLKIAERKPSVWTTDFQFLFLNDPVKLGI